MQPKRWTEVDNLLQSALERPTSEREEFLHAACVGDEELEREVRSLLAARQEAGSFLLNPAIEVAAQAMTAGRAGAGEGAAPEYILPAQIGQYRVLRLLGEGGMGVVYEAVQEHPHRTVALKVVKPGLESSLLRRFEHESQALARLQHPGIAQIYEAGVADAGFGPQPYFAMEFIHGQPLRKFIDAYRLNMREQLGLMGKICQAVEHAHRRGLIHRDLKPGNILVDESGQPKILDFGVARVTDNEAQVTRQTDVGQLVGTLEYMSPEQVLADPMEIDTRSDVYALGVILYEMLAGRRPYKLSRRLHEAVLTIREEDPAPLSSVSGQYRGDIETIVAKALEKDKARRYGSAAELAEDIRRHLADEPILARPASTAYQLQKFARRNKGLVASVAAVFVVLALGIVASTWQAARATRERDRAAAAERAATMERDRALRAENIARRAEETASAAKAEALEERNKALAEKQRADTEAATATAVNSFLQNDLLAQASATTQATPNVRPDPDLKVRTALDRAAARISGKFEHQPLVEASIRATMGETYQHLGLYPEAQPQLERAVELQRGVLGPEHPDTLTSMQSLALILNKEGKYSQSEALLTEILAVRRRTLGDDDPKTVGVMNDLAVVLADHARAEKMLEHVLEVERRTLGEAHPDTLAVMNNLAVEYTNQGDYPGAEKLYKRAIEIKRRTLGEEHPSTLTSMNNLGVVYRFEGKYTEALPLLASVLAIQRRVLGELHSNTLNTANSLALLYQAQGKYAESESLLLHVLEGRGRVLGGENADTLRTKNSLAELYWLQNRRSEAEALLNNVLEVRRRALGPDNPNTIDAAGSLGRMKLEQAKYAEAEILLREALDGYARVNLDGWRRYLTQSLLGACLETQGDHTGAEPLLQSGYQGLLQREASMPLENRAAVEQAGDRIVRFYQNWGKPEKAAEWREKLRLAGK
jgi:tetratricopeptide (TPR) repeat protein/tRNA A-37 threonylcarbamoyl transferase component Bud32